MSSPAPLAHVAVLLQHTDNGKVLPADGQLLAQGVALEGLFLQISADDAYVLVAGSVDVGDKSAFAQVLAAHGGPPLVEEGLTHTINAGALKILAPLPHRQLSGDIGGHAGDVLGIFIHQFIHIVWVHRTGVPPVHKQLDLDQIGAQLLKLLVHHILHAVAQAGDNDDGTHADDDAQHGEQSPHLAGHQGLQGQAEGLSKVHAPASCSAGEASENPPAAGSSCSISSGRTTALGSWASPS